MGHVPHLYLPPPWDGSVIPLSDAHRQHLEKVLRAQEGDPLSYTDGAGRWGAGRMADGGVVRGEEGRREPPTQIAVAVTPPRSRDRARFLVEKLAELGVSRLSWVRTRRTEGRPPPPAKAEAWMAAALEQSRGAWAMEIEETTIEKLDRTALVVADPEGEPSFPEGRSTLLVGPEGGWEEGETPERVPRVSLGPTVLRVETAAMVGAALLRAALRR